MKKIKELVCPHILSMTPYASARSEFKGNANVFLDANENTIRTNYNRYPDPLQNDLKKAIEPLVELDATQIFLGNGSDEAIDLLLRIFCNSGKDAIITLPPTYGMYEVSACLNNIQVIEVPLELDYQPNVEGILAAQSERTKILFLCSPNNPTGNDFDVGKLQQLIEKFEGIVVVDEAYIHFSTQASCTRWIQKYPNLVVLQTFSKAWGMAGIRLGMALASPEIIALFNKVKPPYNVNVLTQKYALSQLQDWSTLKEDIATILSERALLAKALSKLVFVEEIYPSASNFLLVKVTEADTIYQYLIEQGIIIRNRSKVILCDNCLRITIGTKVENEKLLAVLSSYSTLKIK
ncbi:histidinol-phosphate transaminase [Aureispira sp. CCB-E]|uniref:histidinol-phosphate transaminase n=1 Tax=Aureispira sp. CCB-E TaxID=3051121 RepID=UPI0028688146|nr:histidinol-phosphate transaminase [Aureispira sp. CCB-E]WMX12905.1 histidinol-phosphate transaminase [Aureispira sp. CCB-E]